MVNALFMMKGYLVLKTQITIDKYHKYSITGLKPKVAGGHHSGELRNGHCKFGGGWSVLVGILPFALIF